MITLNKIECKLIFVENKDLSHDNVLIPTNIYNKLDKSSKIKLNIGLNEYEININENSTKNEEAIEISTSLLKEMGLPDKIKCNTIINQNEIKIGPIIGVFSSYGYISKLKNQNPIFRLKELVEANKKLNTILYFFTYNSVDYATKKIEGMYYDEQANLWKLHNFPFPDVLYDRGGGTLKSQIEDSNNIRRQFEQLGIKKINPQYYFDKWDVYQNLSKREDIKPYLPLTIKYEKLDDLKFMFNNSKVLYVKDRFGSNGLGVVRVIKFNNKYYYFTVKNYLVMNRVYSINSLHKLLRNIFNGKELIVQEGIPLLKINNRLIDFRATLQRNEQGKIDYEGIPIPVRFGIYNYPITSTRTGSEVYRFEYFFEKYLGQNNYDLKNLEKKINEFLLEIYKAIEDAYGQFGEIGIDFALDKKGKIWFIECNSKPGKDSLKIAYGSDNLQKAFINPLQYAKYISDFKA